MRHHTHTIISVLAWLTLATVGLSSTGCQDFDWREMEFGIPAGDKPHHEFNFLNMWDSPAIKAQDGQPGAYQGMRVPAPNTISVKTRTYPEALKAEALPYTGAGAIGNPVPMTMASLKQGKAMYETYCIVCHGPKGLGNGYIIGEKKYAQQPPSLASSKLRKYRDGQIYHVITNGQGSMSHYRSQVRPMERWAIVHYVRALQRAEFPRATDIERYQASQKANAPANK